MSFRSRSRTTQPVPTTRQRSLSSSSRIGGNGGSTGPSNYNSSSSNYLTPYRPNSSTSSSYSSPMNSYNSYPSSYNKSSYGSKDNLYTSPYNNNGHTSSMSKLNNGMYGGSMYNVPSSTDRYQTSYSQNMDNGVTKASLNLTYMPTTPTTYRRRDYTPSRHQQSQDYLGSTPNFISSSYMTSPISVSLGRSQSLKDQERKSRSRNRRARKELESLTSSTNNISRSYSISSEKSLGYESGSEQSTKSRLNSKEPGGNDDTASIDSKDSDKNINYKELWEKAKLENDKLKLELKKKDTEIDVVKKANERLTNATKNSLSELEKRERRAMERKMSEMEEETKQLDALKAENHRLKEENGALIRVISKLSK